MSSKNILDEIKDAAARRDSIESERAVWLSCHNEQECRAKAKRANPRLKKVK